MIVARTSGRIVHHRPQPLGDSFELGRVGGGVLLCGLGVDAQDGVQALLRQRIHGYLQRFRFGRPAGGDVYQVARRAVLSAPGELAADDLRRAQHDGRFAVDDGRPLTPPGASAG